MRENYMVASSVVPIRTSVLCVVQSDFLHIAQSSSDDPRAQACSLCIVDVTFDSPSCLSSSSVVPIRCRSSACASACKAFPSHRKFPLLMHSYSLGIPSLSWQYPCCTDFQDRVTRIVCSSAQERVIFSVSYALACVS